MTIHQGIISGAVNTAILGAICLAAANFHVFKKLSSASGRKKRERNDADQRPKLIVVSGCDRGFGLLLTEALTASKIDYLVLALTLTEESAKELQLMKHRKGKLRTLKCDVTSKTDVMNMKAVVEQILDEHHAVLYGIVNNAGIANPGDFAWFPDTSVYEEVMDVNYFGQLRLTNALLPLMLRTSQTLSSGPRILNLSSVCGTTSSPSNGAYSASKFAVEAWSDSLRVELQPFNIQVVKIRPGQISTQIQSDWSANCTRNFKAAPDAIRKLYGGEKYVDKTEKVFESRSKGPQMSLPSLVTESLMDILALQDTSKMKPYYWIGSDAHTLWQALHLLPTTVVDTIKFGLMHVAPVHEPVPRPGIVSHLTIKVSDVHESIAFYKAFGFQEFGPLLNGQQFLSSGKGKWWSTLILLEEDQALQGRKPSYNIGMTRLALFSTNLSEDTKKLEAQGMKPMGPIAKHGPMKIAAYKDPDDFVVYYFGFSKPMEFLTRVVQWWKVKQDPIVFHWTINCSSSKHVRSVFEQLGFKTTSDQTSDQVAFDLLPAFNIDKSATVIEHIRLCKLPEDSVFATVMEWKSPKSEFTGDELTNAMTISVADVPKAIENARQAGMFVPAEGAVSSKTLPVYGEVQVGTAYLEEGCNRVEFCCFSNKQC